MSKLTSCAASTSMSSSQIARHTFSHLCSKDRALQQLLKHAARIRKRNRDYRSSRVILYHKGILSIKSPLHPSATCSDRFFISFVSIFFSSTDMLTSIKAKFNFFFFVKFFLSPRNKFLSLETSNIILSIIL